DIVHRVGQRLSGQPGAQTSGWVRCAKVPVRELFLQEQLVAAQYGHVDVIVLARWPAQEGIDCQPAGDPPGSIEAREELRHSRRAEWLPDTQLCHGCSVSAASSPPS